MTCPYKIKEFDSIEAWKKWRFDFIGASDIAAVLNKSPYVKRQDLLHSKKTKTEREVNEFITSKGHKYEAFIRPKAELILGTDLKPANLESTVHPHLSCSLDGWSDDKELIWECKLVGKAVFEEVEKNNRPPTKYEDQIQQQLLISGAEKAIFWCGIDDDTYTFCEVLPDEKMQKTIIEESKKFYEEWHKDVQPPDELVSLIDKFSHRQKQITRIKKRLKLFEDDLDLIKKDFKKIDFRQNVVVGDLMYSRVESSKTGWDLKKLEKHFGDKQNEFKKTSNSISYKVKEVKGV